MGVLGGCCRVIRTGGGIGTFAKAGSPSSDSEEERSSSSLKCYKILHVFVNFFPFSLPLSIYSSIYLTLSSSKNKNNNLLVRTGSFARCTMGTTSPFLLDGLKKK